MYYQIIIKITYFVYRYHVAKLLELNQITTVRDEDVRPSNDANLKLVSFSGKQCHAIIYDSGGK